jgi:hypothetical protein
VLSENLMQKVASELEVGFDADEIKAIYIARGEGVSFTLAFSGKRNKSICRSLQGGVKTNRWHPYAL